MAVYLLLNTFGLSATVCQVSGTALKSGYTFADAMAGQRQYTVRAEAGAAHSLEYIGLEGEVTHAVITRADLFKQTVDAFSIELQYGAAWSIDSTTLVGDMDLIGPTAQDWVMPVDRVSDHFRARFLSLGLNSEYEYGKVFFAKAFSFGVEPQLGPKLVKRRGENTQRVQPCTGYQPHWVEADFSVSFNRVSLAKLLEFEALPLGLAFFFYDDEGHILKHKLEHVVLSQPWSWSRVARDAFNIKLTLSRLCHY